MKETSTSGDFKIPKKIKPGKYIIRAYTNYMRNEGEFAFFKKEINIWGNTVNNEEIDITDINNTEINPKLEFYPEGGYLVNNLKTFVAIKLRNSVFDTINTNIKIIDDQKNIITSFSSTKFGLGIFSITPEKNKNYKAVLSFGGNDFFYDLPKALPKGEILNIKQTENELLVHLQSNQTNGLFNTSIVIHQRGNLIFSNTIQEQTSFKKLKIPLNNIKNGVIHVTLFNAFQKPISERLVFVNNNKSTVDVTINLPKLYYVNKRKVDVTLQIKDSTTQNLEGVFSLTVKDVKNPKDHLKENINTWLLLNSDLKGKVKNPNYFFENTKDRKRKYLLDLIMMTNGWRRFSWQNLLKTKPQKKKFDVEKGFIISGKTYDMRTNSKPLPAVTRLTFFRKNHRTGTFKKSK